MRFDQLRFQPRSDYYEILNSNQSSHLFFSSNIMKCRLKAFHATKAAKRKISESDSTSKRIKVDLDDQGWQLFKNLEFPKKNSGGFSHNDSIQALSSQRAKSTSIFEIWKLAHRKFTICKIHFTDLETEMTQFCMLHYLHRNHMHREISESR